MASNESLDEIDLEDNSALESDNSSSVTSQSSFLWYKVGVFVLFLFPKDLTDVVPPYNQNIRGKCRLCNKLISGRRGANTNFARHYEQVNYNFITLFCRAVKLLYTMHV